MSEEGPIDFSEAFQDCSIRSLLFAQADKRANDKTLIFTAQRAVQDRSRHQRTVLGESDHILGELEPGQGCHSL